MVRHRLRRLTFDVAQAYVQAMLPEGEAIAVRYPDGFKRNLPETGEELYCILRRSLYGHPAAGRYWDKHRNSGIMKEFNKEGWTCTRSLKEPCLMIIRRGHDYAYVLIHTDDGDMVGTSDSFLEEVLEKLNSLWECKRTDSTTMLGIQRHVTEIDGEMEVELTMTPFIEGMMEAFKDYRTSRKKSTPVPEGLQITRQLKKRDSAALEAKAKEIINRGYQRLLGMLLWAARGVFPECLVGTSLMGRVMAAPTEEAWGAAVHMMNYMYQNKHRGLKFSSRATIQDPIVFVDASNKPDPADSKCQYGYVIQWMGGPIVSTSKKLNHIGLSAAHNEYMALHWAVRHTVWLRELLQEMGLGDHVTAPTLVRGDNTAANTLCEEDIVTTGNQFITIPYHYNKEAVSEGQVKVEYVKTTDNIADLLTKAVGKGTLDRLLDPLLGYSPVCP